MTVQQSVSDVTKVVVVVSHFPSSEKCREFWIIRNRTYTVAGLALETNNFTYDKPQALIDLIGGVEKEHALFEAPEALVCFDCKTPLDKNFYEQTRGDSDEPGKLRKVCAVCAGDGTPTWCDTNACERPTCHRCFPREGCYDHEKCRKEFEALAFDGCGSP